MRNRIISLLLSCLIAGSSVIGQDGIVPTHHKTDLSSLHLFIDSLMLQSMNKYNVPGAIISIIQDSQDVYYQGYGYADVENDREVDPELTGFRIASVTKTFTATAVMQLVDRRLIDLNTNVINYLPDHDFTFLDGAPFTLHHLLTHTAGFDFTDIGDAARTPEGVIPLEEFARFHMPAQVHTPGTVFSYSNFGYTLAGYIVQHMSGIPYEQYIQENIFEPLDMRMTNLQQPLGSPYKDHLARGYKWNGKQTYLPRDYTNTIPGGGIISNARDMTRYMMAHLHGGVLDSTRILDMGGHQQLTSQKYGSQDTKYGICYAFFENGWTGRRCLDHSGGQLGFLTLMILIPETGTGIFISHNSRENAGGFRNAIAEVVLDTLLHRKERYTALPNPSDVLDKTSSNYTGTYTQMNSPQSTFEKLGNLLGMTGGEYNVAYNGNGMLQINGDDFVKMKYHVYQENDEKSPWNVEFKVNEYGKVTKIVAGVNSYHKIKWYQNTLLQRITIGISFLLLFAQFLSKPKMWSTLIPRKKIKPTLSQPFFLIWLYWTGTLFVLGLIGIFINIALYKGQVADYGVPLSLKLPLLFNTIAGIASLYSPIALWQLWNWEDMDAGKKAWYTVLILSVFTVAVGFWHYKVIGFHY